jgi:uncharacterized protein
MEDDTSRPKRRCGFASMSKARVQEISRRGGRAAHALGVGHEWTVDEAREHAAAGGRARAEALRQKKAVEAAAQASSQTPTSETPEPAKDTHDDERCTHGSEAQGHEDHERGGAWNGVPSGAPVVPAVPHPLVDGGAPGGLSRRRQRVTPHAFHVRKPRSAYGRR